MNGRVVAVNQDLLCSAWSRPSYKTAPVVKPIAAPIMPAPPRMPPPTIKLMVPESNGVWGDVK